MYASMGTTKAHVFPEPVSAMPMTSRFNRPIGMDAIWIGEGLAYPTFCMARFTCSGIVLSSHERMGRGSRPPLVVMLKSSRKIRQSRSFISSSALSLQCFDAMRRSARSYASSSSLRRESQRRTSALVIASPASARDRDTRFIWCAAFCVFCSRLSTPARSPRPKSSAASCFLSYSGLRSRDVSSALSQSNLNLNRSEALTTFFLTFSAPMYASFSCVSSASLAFSSRSLRRSASRLRSSSRRRSRAQSPASTPFIAPSRLACAAALCSANRFSAASSLSFLLMNVGLALASASSLRFLRSSSSDSGCVG